MSVTFRVEGSEVHFNLANASFAHLVGVLSLDAYPGVDFTNWAGELDPADVLARIGRAERAIAQGRQAEFTAPTEQNKIGRAVWVECGIDAERLARHLAGLERVAVAAIKSDKLIDYI